MNSIDFKYVLEKPYRNILMGFAITWVMLHHFSIFSPSHSSVFSLFAQGSSGVEIFFFLSVYGLCFSFEKYGGKGFYLRRLKRIFPMYFLFLAIWYFGCHFFGIEINSPGKIIASTISCLSCFINMRTETDIVEWYIPAQLFIYLIFPLLYMFIKKVSALRTPYVILYYLFFVGLGIGLSVFASRPLYLRMSVVFIGTLAFFVRGGQKLDLIIFISAISFFFVPHLQIYLCLLFPYFCLYKYRQLLPYHLHH